MTPIRCRLRLQHTHRLPSRKPTVQFVPVVDLRFTHLPAEVDVAALMAAYNCDRADEARAALSMQGGWRHDLLAVKISRSLSGFQAILFAMPANLISQARKLSPSQRIKLVSEIWDSLCDEQVVQPLSGRQKAELDRRLNRIAENGAEGDQWRVVKRRILKARKK
ncbi:MAG TPA: addiction module protein [Tepidisphaeraceae bacterium]|nr:addiction module protein [Tepidisphaeraceae bacterium]